MFCGLFKERGEGILSTEELEKVLAGKNVEERQQLEGGIFSSLQGPKQFQGPVCLCTWVQKDV